MKKAIIVGTIMLTASLLIGGAYYPDFPLMWMAGTTNEFQLVRAGLMVILTILLFSNPPRMLAVRFGIAAAAVVLGFATVQLLSAYQLNLFDAIVFAQIAIIFGIEALESPQKYTVNLHQARTTAAAQ